MMSFRKYKLTSISETALKSTTEKHSQELPKKNKEYFGIGEEIITYISEEVGEYFLIKWAKSNEKSIKSNIKYAYKSHWKKEPFYSEKIDLHDRRMFVKFKNTKKRQ